MRERRADQVLRADGVRVEVLILVPSLGEVDRSWETRGYGDQVIERHPKGTQGCTSCINSLPNVVAPAFISLIPRIYKFGFQSGGAVFTEPSPGHTQLPVLYLFHADNKISKSFVGS